MARLFLALAMHNHQPVGNFDFVFRDAYRQAYEPMVAALERHPAVRLALHYTGPLRDWILANEPSLFARVRALVARGQVEILAGGYYEPVLAALPDADKHGQLRKLVDAVEADFGSVPAGAWLAERVWEPSLPKPLAEAGIEYTILDDTHFKHAGYDPETLTGYYLTEEQGYPVKVFPTSLKLRYTIPWRPVEEIVDWLREQADDTGSKLLSMGDDGEKFGHWPGTFAPMWEEDGGWIHRFFEALEQHADWLQTITYGDFARRFPPAGRIYLPTTSYDEMTEWALPAEAAAAYKPLKARVAAEHPEALRYLRGGFWRNFMVKYPEVNTLHKKALQVSHLVHALPAGETKDRALDELWKGQGNCPYWHGVFGGIYLGNLRQEMFAHLIEAENLADPAADGATVAEIADLDLDGYDEIALRSGDQTLYVDPVEGGSVYEWDWRPAQFNLTNVMSRRFEGYHPELLAAVRANRTRAADAEGSSVDPKEQHAETVRVKEELDEGQIHYDWHRRSSFVDHVLGHGTTLEAYARAQYREAGDFVTRAYRAEVVERDGATALRLTCDGQVWDGPDVRPLRVEKTLVPGGPVSDRTGASSGAGETTAPAALSLRAEYRLTNPSEAPLSVRFGVETDWALLGGASPEAFATVGGEEPERLNVAAAAEGVSEFRLVDPHVRCAVEVELSRPATLWRFPLETVSLSEGGYERVLQGVSVLPHWHIELAPGGSADLTLSFIVRRP